MTGFSLSRLWIAPLVKLGLARSPARVARAIQNFSATEAETAWQLLYAFERIDNSVERVELFSQIIEESSHAKIFATLYENISGRKFVPLRVERKPLYPNTEDLWKLNVYFKIGEEQAVKRFENIESSLEPGALKNAIQRILLDEAKHVNQADDLVNQKDIPNEALQKHIRIVHLNRFKESWLRIGKTLVQKAGRLILHFTYFSLAPFAWTLTSKKLSHPKRTLL